MADLRDLKQAMSDLKEDQVYALVKEKLEAGIPATEILAGCREGLAELGKRFENGECYIPELMFGGVIMKKVVGELSPMLEETETPEGKAATIVIGTVHRDIHDIGKDIVVLMLRGSGFNVIDLGVNVSPDKFLEAVKENNASVVGMSVFLTTCCRFIGETVEAFKEANLRDNVSIMIGGAAASDMVSERTGCDFYGETAVDAVAYATKVTKAA